MTPETLHSETTSGGARWGLLIAVALAGIFGCDLLDPSAASPGQPTLMAKDGPTASSQEPTAAPPTETEVVLAEGQRTDLLPNPSEASFEAELTLKFNGQTVEGQAAQAHVERHILNQPDPLYVFRRTIVDAENTPGLAPPEAPVGERVRILILAGDTLYVQDQNAALETCYARELPAEVDALATQGQRGLVDFDQYIAAALDAGDPIRVADETINGVAAEHFQTGSTTIWTDTRASVDIWTATSSDRIVRAELKGEGVLPPYGQGNFAVEISSTILEHQVQAQIPEACSVQ